MTALFGLTHDEVELLLKVCIEYKTSKTNENTDWESCQELSAQQEQQKCIKQLAAMLFCSRTVKKTVETAPDLAKLD